MICVCTPRAYSAHGGRKKALNSLELDLEMVMSHGVGDWN